MTRFARLLILLALSCVAAVAQADVISRYARFTGNYNYVATGGTLRNSASNGCTLNSSSSQMLSGIPAGARIAAAYLYWGGSGSTVDSVVSLNGGSIFASRTFTTTFTNGGTSYPFFGGFADVTSRITGNGSFTFSGLSVDSGTPFCDVSAVVAGWSLIVIYESSSERLRALNIFDGLDYFRGSAVSLTPNGFRIPSSNIDGKMTVVTWEGDPGNSDPLNGFSESLSFNGNALDDGIVPSGSSPTVQQYDGTINTLGLDNTYGVDVDTYDLTPYLSPGQTSATTYYSAGGDLVLLTAQIISVTSEPQIDLSITKTHSGNFTVGGNASYTLHVANEAGVQPVDYPVTVTDTLPAGLTYVSATGTGWTCGAAGQVMTCTHPAPLASGSAFPDIALTVSVGNAAYPSISNTATVSSTGSQDNTTGNNSATDTATVLGSNLSASTKSVADLNGGEADPGDTLRYTITMTNSSAIAATAVTVTDNIPGNVSGFSVTSIPSGASNVSTGTGTGANNNGFLNITGITVPANGSATVVFDVTVAAGASPGATIDNTATINNPAGVGATPSAPQVVVSPSRIAGSGVKNLYLWSNPDQRLYRTPPGGAQNSVTISGAGGNSSWLLTPALQQNLTLQSGGFPVRLLLSESGQGSNRNVTVTLANSALGTLASAGPTSVALSGSPNLITFTLILNSAVTVPAGSTFTLTITNSTGGTNASARVLTVYPLFGGNNSRIELNSATVINVDSVQTYTATYAGGVVTTSFTRGSTAYVRAVVSDPFGSFDISGATITLRNPSGTDVVTAAAMTQVNDSGAAAKIYQYSYAIPGNAPAGTWSARVTANEGTEGTINDLGIGAFTVTVPMPTLQVTKVANVIWDPVNLSNNPKRIPGSIIGYTITVTNTGTGPVDASTLVITDPIPEHTRMCVANVGQCTVLQFTDGTPASGLSYGSGNTTYSNTVGGGIPFTYTPTADADGVDAAVTGIRVAPGGALSAASGSGNPGFSIHFRVKLQ
ncbi:MAG: hypothetical protein AB7T07_12500 [Steroidobacteraceae bacterium]